MATEPTAQEAWEKLKGHIGKLDFFLTPGELKAIETAVVPKKAAPKKTAKGK